MRVEIKVPEVGESIQEAILAEWLKNDGERIEKDEPVFVIETDKVTLEVPASESGTLEILVAAGETVAIGAVVGKIDTSGAAAEKKPDGGEAAAEPSEKAGAGDVDEPPARDPESKPPKDGADERAAPVVPPSVRRMAAEHGIDLSRVEGTGRKGQVTKEDVVLHLKSGQEDDKDTDAVAEAGTEKQPPGHDKAQEETTRKRMSPIRRTIASRLLAAKQNTAMLTTFNEIDMGRVKSIREEFKDAFFKRHGVRLGFMSFFVKAAVSALQEFPVVNAEIDGDDMVYHHYYHVGIAIGSEKGLVVPVLRHADRLSFAQVESRIVEFADKVKNNRLALSDLEGGTFSITNGGIYGSLMSTPILNMPQSAILGMHKIEDRPVAIDGQVVIRPMMYVALSYDHRIVDGKDAVTFLRRIKEFIENPERMILEI